jgi:hypothetical protein
MSIKLNERNEALFSDWKLMKAHKMKMWKIVAKYHISVSRITYLCNEMFRNEALPLVGDDNKN